MEHNAVCKQTVQFIMEFRCWKQWPANFQTLFHELAKFGLDSCRIADKCHTMKWNADHCFIKRKINATHKIDRNKWPKASTKPNRLPKSSHTHTSQNRPRINSRNSINLCAPYFGHRSLIFYIFLLDILKRPQCGLHTAKCSHTGCSLFFKLVILFSLALLSFSDSVCLLWMFFCLDLNESDGSPSIAVSSGTNCATS